jgi:hypothetical protein
VTPNPDYEAIRSAVLASHPDIMSASTMHRAESPGLIEVRIVARRPITFGDEVWLAANDAASDANPLVDARVVEATWA